MNADLSVTPSPPATWVLPEAEATSAGQQVQPAQRRWVRAEYCLVAVLALVFALSVFLRTRSQPGFLLDNRATNVLFDADIPQVFAMMNKTKSIQHFRTQAHPLFPLLTYPVVRTATRLGLSPLAAAGILNGVTAALWLTLLYLTIRRLGCSPLAAVLLSALGALSASALYFFSVPETYALSSVSLLVPLLVATNSKHSTDERLLLGASCISLSVTVTNWLAGILLAASHTGWQKAIRITGHALAIVALLTAIQARAFPLTHSFLEKGYAEYYAVTPSLGRVASVASAYFFHTLIAPRWTSTQFDGTPAHALSFQTSTPGSASVWGQVAVVLWVALLGFGLYQLLRDRKAASLRLLLPGLIALQLFLHCWFGAETFLYSLHFLPLLLILAACGCRARTGRWALPVCAALLACVVLNNLPQQRSTSRYLSSELARLSNLPTANP